MGNLNSSNSVTGIEARLWAGWHGVWFLVITAIPSALRTSRHLWGPLNLP